MKLKAFTDASGQTVGYHFWCPGCEDTHPYQVIPSTMAWQFNGDLEKPTFTPSLLVHPHRTFKKDVTREEIAEAQKITPEGQPLVGITFMTPRCHLFLTDGKLSFCSDSEHRLAGQTVDLPDWPFPEP